MYTSHIQVLRKEKNIPEFKSGDEELEFWDTHSALDYLDEKSEVVLDASKAREKRARREARRGDGCPMQPQS